LALGLALVSESFDQESFTCITDVEMAPTVDEKIVATHCCAKHAAADGNGAWIIATYDACLFAFNQAVAALEPCRAPGRRVRRRRPAHHRQRAYRTGTGQPGAGAAGRR
jgi:hypothetical protein